MRKRTSLSIVERAINTVFDFKLVIAKLHQQITLDGQSQRKLNSYRSRIALFVIHYEKLPEPIDQNEINE